MMTFVKLSVGYYRDVAVATLDDAHEVLFTRGLAYSGDANTGGFVPDSILPSLVRSPTPRRCKALASALVRAGLWTKREGGYQIKNWEHWQEQLDILGERRRRDRERKAAERSAARRSPRTVRGKSADCPSNVQGAEEEEEEEDAAASTDTRTPAGTVTELPPPLLDLQKRLNDARLAVRWDRLTCDQVDVIADLIAAHGATRLVKSAQGQWQKDNPPSWAQAWIGGWQALPRAVATAKRPKCPTHEVELPCIGCAADAKAAG